jgi:hypothetical protein
LKAVPRVAKRRRTRGVVIVEYALLLVGLGIPFMTAAIAGGVKMVHGYTITRNLLLHEGP